MLNFLGDAQIDPVSIDNNNDICSAPISAVTKSVISNTDVSFRLRIFHVNVNPSMSLIKGSYELKRSACFVFSELQVRLPIIVFGF